MRHAFELSFLDLGFLQSSHPALIVVYHVFKVEIDRRAFFVVDFLRQLLRPLLELLLLHFPVGLDLSTLVFLIAVVKRHKSRFILVQGERPIIFRPFRPADDAEPSPAMTIVDFGGDALILFCDLCVLLHECLGIADGHEVVRGYGADFTHLEDVCLLDGHEELLVGLLDEFAELVV